MSYLEPKRGIVHEGWGKRFTSRNQTRPPEPGEVFGKLTTIARLGPTSIYTRFRCECGEEVTRAHRDVRKAVRNGGRPACPECNKRQQGRINRERAGKEQSP